MGMSTCEDPRRHYGWVLLCWCKLLMAPDLEKQEKSRIWTRAIHVTGGNRHTESISAEIALEVVFGVIATAGQGKRKVWVLLKEYYSMRERNHQL